MKSDLYANHSRRTFSRQHVPCFHRLSMELSFLPCAFWDNDSKFQQHHLADVLTSVHATRDLPLGAAFGPCVLQNTFYDTIAFIALKSCDKRNRSYVFRVSSIQYDSSAMRALFMNELMYSYVST